MKKTCKILVLILTLFLITGCDSKKLNRIGGIIELKLDNCKIRMDEDTHGGFLGDGEYFAKIECDTENESIKESWKELPLGAEIQKIMTLIQCGDKGCLTAFERYNIPNIKNGYYYFVDRHSEAVDKHNEEELNNRASYNFSVCIYDSDNKLYYYYELDT